ncbi:MAG TPA: nucleotidyltransferase family protein [Solirubrobacteraceae bacterium]|nr:nucleotidyltransferase family protein [Solirubrobacteraceae bacterium]
MPEFVAGLVLAAGGSSRLGQPKQLLPFGRGTLLDHVLSVARECPFDQRLCVIGGGAPEVRQQVDFGGVQVVENDAFGSGCSSSIAAALGAVDERAGVLVLMLGDQPGVSVSVVERLISGRGGAPLAVCAYTDGRGHPLALGRAMFPQLAELHGDKAVWKLMDRLGDRVVEVPIETTVPRDVDTWEDYEAVRAELGALAG